MISNAKTPAAAKRLQGVPTCCNGGFVTKLTCSAPTTSYPQHPGWFALLYSFWLAQMQGSPAPGLAVLSMHQPWASLLVYGLKRIEGRAWPTDYNGRLWIHATSTKPTAQDIEVLPAMDSSAPALQHRNNAHAPGPPHICRKCWVFTNSFIRQRGEMSPQISLLRILPAF